MNGLARPVDAQHVWLSLTLEGPSRPLRMWSAHLSPCDAAVTNLILNVNLLYWTRGLFIGKFQIRIYVRLLML